MTDPTVTNIDEARALADELAQYCHECCKDGSLAVIDSLIEGMTVSFLIRLLFCIAPVYMLKKLRIKIESNV
tara:strand:- start:14988 stop:15203 length:216 start_codon:yes stop_codon:yes gene_type:complete